MDVNTNKSLKENMKILTRKLNYKALTCGSIEENLKLYGFSTRICNLLKKELGLVKVNGKALFLTAIISKNDLIEVQLKEYAENVIKYEKAVNIIYEDEDIAVINKSPDIAVIATKAHYGYSLMNCLANIWGDFVYHPVNRLDKGTSGVMLVAKNMLTHSILSNNLTSNCIEKNLTREYTAIVMGNLSGSGVINAPIGQVKFDRIERSVMAEGKEAITEYQSLNCFDKFSLIKLKLKTGRTHQIRVHMNHIGHPLLGDNLYGGDCDLITRPALHSYKISFYHPIKNEIFTFFAPMPKDMEDLLVGIKNK